MGEKLPYKGSVSIKVEGLDEATMQFRAEEVPAGTIKIAKGFTEAVVYTLVRSLAGGGFERVGGDESLYLYAGGTGTLPKLPKGKAYVAVYLKGARLEDGGQPTGLDVREIVEYVINSVATGGRQPTGPGPTHSYP